jgi:hypothetical protein
VDRNEATDESACASDAVRHAAVQARREQGGEAARRRADASSALGQEYSLRGTDYVLAVVLFAASLFFAGISTKLGERRFKATILACGWMIFLGTVLWVATFPISISI